MLGHKEHELGGHTLGVGGHWGQGSHWGQGTLILGWATRCQAPMQAAGDTSHLSPCTQAASPSFHPQDLLNLLQPPQASCPPPSAAVGLFVSIQGQFSSNLGPAHGLALLQTHPGWSEAPGCLRPIYIHLHKAPPRPRAGS